MLTKIPTSMSIVGSKVISMTDYETRWLAICNEAIRLDNKSTGLLIEYRSLQALSIAQMIDKGLIQKGMRK